MVKIHWVLLINLLFFGEFIQVKALTCYSCSTALSGDIDKGAQLAFRVFSNTAYKIPPVNRFCHVSNDIEFKTVPTVHCPINDQCVKMHASNSGLDFVIRGCSSKLFKSAMSKDVECSANQSPSVCFCRENSCNSSSRNATSFLHSSLLFYLFLAIVIICTSHVFVTK